MNDVENILKYTIDRTYRETMRNGDSEKGLNGGLQIFKEYIESTDINNLHHTDSNGNNILHKIVEYRIYDFYEYLKKSEKTKELFHTLTEKQNNYNMTPFDLLKSNVKILNEIHLRFVTKSFYSFPQLPTNKIYKSQYKKMYNDMLHNKYKSNNKTIDNIILSCELMQIEKKSPHLNHMINEFKRIKKYKVCFDGLISNYTYTYYKDVELHNKLYGYPILGFLSCFILYFVAL